MSQLLDGLTQPQLEAVTHTDGPLLVLAAAGSGKTRVITRRAVNLATTVTRPRHVLAITFTNKAANEMKERVAAQGIGRDMLVCTFHSLCARLLRWYAAEANLSPNFSILDEGDSRSVVKKAITEAGMSSQNWAPAMVKARISDAKNRLMKPEQYAAEAFEYADRNIAKIYQVYQDMLAQQQAVDFDDLLMHTAFLLGGNPQLREQLEDRFRYVLIDEYQDTNHAQYMIARGLTLSNENICATGDPDQSIYAWRGADIRNILEFEHDFPSAKVVRLEQNYRSTKRILSAASALIKTNSQRKEKELWTENEQGPQVRVVELEAAEDEGDFLVEEIERHRETQGSLSDIAVFYRVNALTRIIEEAFLRAGVPYQIARGTEFYNRKEIKDLLAYLRVVINPADEIAFLRAIATPSRGIGKTTTTRLLAFAQQQGLPIVEAARAAEAIPDVRSNVANKIKRFVTLIDAFCTQLEQPVEIIVDTVATDSGLKGTLTAQGEADNDALENVAELVSAAADFTQNNPEGTLAEWLQQISLVSDVDSVDSAAGSVTLMTLHAAKGLEFPRVYIIGVEDGLLPHARYRDNPGELEEERRLCFVGMTRAKQQLTLSHARWRMLRGMTIRTTESQFLTELPHEEIEWVNDSGIEDSFADRKDLERPPQGDYKSWRTGMYLRHPTFGVGQLLWKQGSGKFTRAGLRFTLYGEKTLILEYAKLEPLDPDECQL